MSFGFSLVMLEAVPEDAVVADAAPDVDVVDEGLVKVSPDTLLTLIGVTTPFCRSRAAPRGLKSRHRVDVASAPQTTAVSCSHLPRSVCLRYRQLPDPGSMPERRSAGA